MLFPLTTMRAFVARDISGNPNVLAYLQRIGERPAYRRAMQKGDPQMTPSFLIRYFSASTDASARATTPAAARPRAAGIRSSRA